VTFAKPLHVRVRGSGTQAQLLCGAEKHGDVTQMASMANPACKLDITCGNCRRLWNYP
jgi:hypothetical protein